MTALVSKPYVLDTSALLALIEDEAGVGRVEELLRVEQVILPFVVGLEVYYIARQEQSQDEAARRLALIRQLPAAWEDRVTDTVLVTARDLKSQYRVSLADALTAAFATTTGAILMHKDPEYKELAAVVEQKRLPSKASS